MMTIDELKNHIRSIANFLKPGINFYDITTLLAEPEAFKYVIDEMALRLENVSFDKIVGIEARGFIFATALALQLKKPLILVRKSGKLPSQVISQHYDLEYGNDHLEIHADSISANDRVIIVDDLLATGGTINAVCKLIETLEVTVAAIVAMVALTFLPFKERLEKYNIHYLLDYKS